MRRHEPIPAVRSVLLFPSRSERAREAAVSAAGWLCSRGTRVAVPQEFHESAHDLLPAAVEAADPDALSPDYDLMIALGGDGTLLRSARGVVELGIPVMGVNLGTLGFLSAYGASQVIEAAQAAVEGRLVWESRIRMVVQVHRGGEVFSRQVACNDAYVKHGERPRMLRLSTSVGGHKMADYRADGIIVATPMGSTAYNLAAGGPIVDAGTQAFIITPICPHSLTHRPVVTSSQSRIGITFVGPAEPGAATLSVDGQWSLTLEVGDEISFEPAEQPLKLVPPHASVFQILRFKLGWSAREGL